MRRGGGGGQEWEMLFGLASFSIIVCGSSRKVAGPSPIFPPTSPPRSAGPMACDCAVAWHDSISKKKKGPRMKEPFLLYFFSPRGRLVAAPDTLCKVVAFRLMVFQDAHCTRGEYIYKKMSSFALTVRSSVGPLLLLTRNTFTHL